MVSKNLNYKLGLLVYSVFIGIVPLLLLWKTGLVYSGSDMQFHISRIAEVADAFKHGQFLNITAIISDNAAGSMVNQFYPYLTLIPAVFLKLMIHNDVMAYYVTLLFYNIVTFLIAYYAFTKISKRKQVGIWGATLASLSMYRLFSLIGTSAFGEFIAIGLIPLIWWGYVKVISENKWGTLYIGMTLLAYTHLLSLVMVVAILGVITVVRWLVSAKLPVQELLGFLKAGFATGVSWLPYLIPYIVLTHSNNIANPYAGLVMGSIKPFMGYLMDYQFTRGVGLALLLANLLVLLCWKKIDKNTKWVFISGTIIVALASTIFPWALFADTPVKTIQFPYRFLVIGSVLLAYAGGVGIDQVCRYKSRIYGAAWQLMFIILIVGISLFGIHRYGQTDLSKFGIADNKTKVLSYTPYASYAVNNETFDKQFILPFKTYGAYDYWTQESISNKDFYQKPIKQVQKLGTHGRAQQYVLDANRDTNIEIPTIMYEGVHYDVLLDKHKITVTKGAHGGMVVHVSKGKHFLSVKTNATVVQKLVVIIALVPLLYIIWSSWKFNRKKINIE